MADSIWRIVEGSPVPSAISHRPSAIGHRLLVIVGPTAVGKTALSIALAERVGGEIVSADSRYLYRGLDIGTAKPTLAERARIPHHLVDVTDPGSPWTLVDYQSAATSAIESIHLRGHLPMLVGGTGQYIKAVLEGWRVPRQPPDETLRGELEDFARREGPAALHARLQAVDPAAAGRIDPRNVRRVVRALEVSLSTGRAISTQQKKRRPPYRVCKIGLCLPRPELYARIDERVEAMLKRGLVDEVRALAARYPWTLPAMSALGYRQIGAYLRGECDLAEASRRIKRDTRVFVRRQANWFRLGDPAIHWLDLSTNVTDEIEAVARQWLAAEERREKAGR